MKIDSRIVVVTGASRGIGAATAKAMAHRGGDVVLLARSSEVDRVAAEIVARGDKARAYRVDLTDSNAVAAVTQTILTEVGMPDILINNAGAGRWLFVQETSPAEAMEMMACPYFSAFYITRAFLPAMLTRDQGHIVNLTSPAARLAWPGATGYTVARWAMRGFTEALRADLRGTAIQVTLAVPGRVSTSYFEDNQISEERMPKIANLIPALTPEQVAAAIVDGVEHERREIVIPTMLRLFFLLHSVAPRPVEWLIGRTGLRRPVSTSA